ncbi:uncharacterized protein LOC133184981 [Saccostrea echinata]|uniref:uncharacterized protein LOC133184981 n=1 Tax=Saccostrea echinata TaxID=191078 RepID=UPI002A7F0A35|nr:uncharacterized protein LOC133184981 [Saccostrea echinata]
MSKEMIPLLPIDDEIIVIEENHLQSPNSCSQLNELYKEEGQASDDTLTKHAEETEEKTVLGQDEILQSVSDCVIPLPPGKKYHLFVSYSSEDREHANMIREQMENRFHLKCMDFERDFIPGKNIDENISDEMAHSVKVLLILSPYYVQSHWCVTEAREACTLSFTDVDNLNVIPLVLKPLHKELPSFLKSFVYIDAQKELDVPAKIYEAFNHPGSLDPLHQDRSATTQNGVVLCRKIASKAKYAQYGLSFRFPPLETFEEEKIRSFSVDPTQLENHYGALINDLNKRYLFGNYPVLTTLKWRCCALFILLFVVFFIFGALYALSGIPGSKLYDRDLRIGVFISGLTLLCSICPCGLCIIYACRRILSSSIHSTVCRYNLKFHRSSKCLVYFDNNKTLLSKPTLYIFKYDVTECEKYLSSLLKEIRPTVDSDTNEETAKNLIVQKLRELQETNGLINWTSLPESVTNRHRTRNYRACLCEMMEDYVKMTYRNTNIIVV